jgi:hypothetical protein
VENEGADLEQGNIDFSVALYILQYPNETLTMGLAVK